MNTGGIAGGDAFAVTIGTRHDETSGRDARALDWLRGYTDGKAPAGEPTGASGGAGLQRRRKHPGEPCYSEQGGYSDHRRDPEASPIVAFMCHALKETTGSGDWFQRSAQRNASAGETLVSYPASNGNLGRVFVDILPALCGEGYIGPSVRGSATSAINRGLLCNFN